jgi:hypothetical protein
VHPLDVDVEHRVRIDADAGALMDGARERRLVGSLDLAELFLQRGVAGAGCIRPIRA